MAPPSVSRLRHVPDLDAAVASGTPGSALFEGWSDEGTWRIALPWPESTVSLPWKEAAAWKSLLADLERDTAASIHTPVPFTGGWTGFLCYEAGATVENVRPVGAPPREPAAFFARHAAGIAISPAGDAYFFGPDGSRDRYFARVNGSVESRSPGSLRLESDSLGEGLYRRRVEEIREAIRSGEVYQVNLTRALTASGSADAIHLYRALTHGRAPRSSALICGDGWSVASASPEVLLLFDARSGVAESRPIKGTVRRSGDEAAEIEQLLGSEKDAAEHLMIVDVVRNDLGKVTPPGSVTVPDFRTVRTLEYVHHLESTVRAEGLRGLRTCDVLEALLPAASITGAPKRAAVRMIREIEPAPRGVYCGSIGMITPGGSAFSVAIRTALATKEEVRFHAGGGIVWDSDAAAEDDECRAKAQAFLQYVAGQAS